MFARYKLMNSIRAYKMSFAVLNQWIIQLLNVDKMVKFLSMIIIIGL